jgi:hypothetical protein
LPITIVNPKSLHNILRNISLCLPENYELAAGTIFESIYSYNDLIKEAIVGSIHNVKLIMYVPIKTANQNFTVYRIIGLPNRIGKDKFVLYQIDLPYFVTGSRQRDYALIQKQYCNNARQAPLLSARLPQPSMTYKLLHVRQVCIFRLQEKIHRVKDHSSES